MPKAQGHPTSPRHPKSPRHRTAAPRRGTARSSRGLARAAPSPRELIARLLDTPHLARVVPHLPADVLHRVVRHCGLEECGDLLTLATVEQLSAVFDLDLWSADVAGRDERFDVARFCQWLEVLADADVAIAAHRLAELDQQLVIAGLASQIAVYDPAAFSPAVELTGADVAVHSLLEGRLRADVGGYIVVAKSDQAWDTIVGVLAALDAYDRACFERVMRGCRQLSNSTPEVDGLDDLPHDSEQLRFDLAVSRERRRDDRGYVTPAQARAFLQSARTSALVMDCPPAPDPIFAAFLRSIGGSLDQEVDSERVHTATDAIAPDESPEAVAAVLDLLRDAGVGREQPQRLLPRGDSSERSRTALFEQQLRFVRDHDGVAYAARTQELAFLGNALLSGCSLRERGFTEPEASRAVAAICNLGLENWPAPWMAGSEPQGVRIESARLPADLLLRQDAVTAFQVGWGILYRDVTMFVAAQVLDVIADVRCSDRDVAAGLFMLRRELTKSWRAGTPWRARDAFEVLAIFDLPAWAALLALIDECPVMLANVAHHPSPVHSIRMSEFDFISENAQIAAVRSFVGSLPDVLIGS